MPISREEFRYRRIDLAFPIARLLEDWPDSAFTVEDIHQLLVDTHGRYVEVNEVEQALETLITRHRVEKAEIAGQKWYAIVRRRLGFLKE